MTQHGAGALRDGTLVDPRSWVELAQGASLTIRHADSAREVTLTGPAYATLCPRGEEEILLTRGRLSASPGPGARPGAEVLVATPFGVVVYGNAKLDVRAEAKRLDLVVQAGDAWIRPAAGATRSGPEHVEAGHKAAVTAASTAPDRLLADCDAAAREAARRAAALLGGAGKDAGGLGDRAARHIQARQAARERCAVAAAAVGLTRDPGGRTDEWARFERSERLWRALPVRPE